MSLQCSEPSQLKSHVQLTFINRDKCNLSQKDIGREDASREKLLGVGGDRASWLIGNIPLKKMLVINGFRWHFRLGLLGLSECEQVVNTLANSQIAHF